MLQDLRLGVRMLLKQPDFTLIAVLTLALGIGATSAVFSLIRGVLLTPPPYRQPQQLVLIPAARTDGRQMTQPRGWPAAQWMEWQKEAKSFEALAAYDWSFNLLVLNDGSVSMEGMWVTRDYFRALGLQPIGYRGDAPRRPFSSVAGKCTGAELQRERTGRFLDSRSFQTGRVESAVLECGRAVARRNHDQASAR